MGAGAIASIGSTYQEVIVDRGEQPALLMLVAFGLTFGITRFITHSIRSKRFSWLKDVEAGDTHVHHLVYGICLLLISGVLAIIVEPPAEFSAVVFGVGAALTLDEFALWLHLDDVYWSEQGRESIDAVIVFAIVSGFMVIGAYPITIGTTGGFEDIVGLLAGQAVLLGFSVICFLKGKLLWGVFGIYFFPIGMYGASRLAKPSSWWARHRYDDAKLALSRKRYRAESEVHKPAVT